MAKEPTIEFNKWLKELDEVAVKTFHFTYYPSKQTGGKCWFGYYKDGYTPYDAIFEDLSYGV